MLTYALNCLWGNVFSGRSGYRAATGALPFGS